MKLRWICLSILFGFGGTSNFAFAKAGSSQDQGMVISCPMYGKIWGSDAMRTAIKDVQKIGSNAIQIHPYARIEKDGNIRFTPAKKTGYLTRATQIAAEEKIKLFWKPHLAYWGSFSWRGAITFTHEKQWKRFFRDYERWILDQARFAQAAKLPLFAVGTELDKTLHRSEWNQVIRKVRQVYKGQLTYAANWDAYTKVPFWSQLDVIGIQAYFPITSPGQPVSAENASKGWRAILSELERYSQQQKRPILFTELGYTRSIEAGEKPWAPKMLGDYEKALRTQKTLLSTVLSLIKGKKFILGVYLWKWMPGFSPWERDFAMREKPIQATIKTQWH